MLVHNKVGVHCRAEEVIAIWALLNSPSEVGLVTMCVTIPDADLGLVLSITTIDVGNCMRSELTDNPDLSARSSKAVGISVWARVHWNKSPMEIGLTDILPLGNGSIIGSLGSLKVNTGSRMDERNGPVTTSNVPECNLQIALVSMGTSVP